jgi:hypothetical protein
MSECFDVSYDRSVLGTREELAITLGLKSVALAKILKEASVPAAGTVRTGTVGKPPSLFRVTEVRVAVEAHRLQQEATKAAAAAARKLKAKPVKVAKSLQFGTVVQTIPGDVAFGTDSPLNIDEAAFETVSTAVAVGE